MTVGLPRFFVDPSVLGDSAAGRSVPLPGPVGQQVSRVLRLRAGQRIVLLDGRGAAVEAVLRTIPGNPVVAELAGSASCAAEAAIEVTLLAAVLKGERQDWLIQKAVELGVARIQPILAERGVARADGEKPERWRRIAREAAEQCERAIVPEIADPVALPDAAWAAPRALVCTERDGEPIGSLVSRQDRQLAILIGPEGGWTPAERAELAERGAIAASLGPRVLRSETAALAALALVILNIP